MKSYSDTAAGQEEKKVNRLEERYNRICDILAWCHGKYTEEYLRSLTMPELTEIYNEVYFKRLEEVQMIWR